MRRLYMGAMALGFVVILGAAGGSDIGTMELTEAVCRALAGLTLMVVGAAGLAYIETKGERTTPQSRTSRDSSPDKGSREWANKKG